MQELTLFNQNFAPLEGLLQLHQVFYGLTQTELSDKLRLDICPQWAVRAATHVRYARNGRVGVLARSAASIPDYLLMPGGLDFLLRQATVVACTALETSSGTSCGRTS
jgi:hypothetical protein